MLCFGATITNIRLLYMLSMLYFDRKTSQYSHMFLVMYQEIRFLNQDTCFLNQEERRQFLISSVSERGWKRPHRFEFKMASNRFYIPSANEFFNGLLSGLCERKRWRDTQNFLQDKLRVMYGQVTESTQENQLTQDLELLMQVIDSRLQSLALSLSRQYRRVKYYPEFKALIYSQKVR